MSIKKFKINIFLILLLCLTTVSKAEVSDNNKIHQEEKTKMQLMTIELPHHDILRASAGTVKFPLDKRERQFIKEFQMFFHDLKSPLGKPAGLAAPQVSLSKRIIIFQIPPEAKLIRKNVYDIYPPTIWINPSYVPNKNAGKNKDWEGCYSVTNKMGEVYRYNEIHYQAYTIDGKKIEGIAKGFFARLIQHEVGHLNGQLYIDLLCEDCRFGPQDAMMKIRKQEMQ